MILTYLKHKFSTLSKVIVSRQSDIGIISLNSKKDVNCLSIETDKQLSDSINEFSKDPAIKLVILKSSVPGLFCAGGNIKYFYTATYSTFKNNDIFKQLYAALNNIKKPIVTAINGTALGGGFQMALITDFILCSRSSKFAMPQLKLGISTVIGAAQRLPRLVGHVNASRIILGTETMNAEKVYQLGIVSEVFDDEEFDQKVLQFCKKITENDLNLLIKTKQLIREADSNNHFGLIK